MSSNKKHKLLIGIFWFIAFLMVIPHHREAIAKHNEPKRLLGDMIR
jgi:membrane protein CcdC involved in cytochrome C biogenesis